MNYIGALAIEGKSFNYRTNERLYKALELKLFETAKDSIKLTSLVSNASSTRKHRKRSTSSKSRPDEGLRLLRCMRHRRVELRGQHFCARVDAKECAKK